MHQESRLMVKVWRASGASQVFYFPIQILISVVSHIEAH